MKNTYIGIMSLLACCASAASGATLCVEAGRKASGCYSTIAAAIAAAAPNDTIKVRPG
jgi:hypothetical protein